MENDNFIFDRSKYLNRTDLSDDDLEKNADYLVRVRRSGGNVENEVIYLRRKIAERELRQAISSATIHLDHWRPLLSARSGKRVRNQFQYEAGAFMVFRSYGKDTAARGRGQVFLGRYWDHSATTLKYVKAFLFLTDDFKLSKKQMEDKINSGEYFYVEFAE